MTQNGSHDAPAAPAGSRASGDGAVNGPRTLSIDAMSGDLGPEPVLEAIAGLRAQDPATYGAGGSHYLLFGDEARLSALVERLGLADVVAIRHAPGVVAMDDKPSRAVRRGKGTSMWEAIASVRAGEAQVALSAGNTGALMGMSILQLRMASGVDRPAIAASWPTPRGYSVVLDVGAGLEADARQLMAFAVMGEAFCRAVHAIARPSVGLLNVGEEETKGHDNVRAAHEALRADPLELNYVGFVEGDDISAGAADVVVTDGFTGNIALKTAEGTARLIGGWVKEALTSSWLSKGAALLIRPALRVLGDRMDPANVNGGVFLGLNGVVVKSHGGSDARGVANALRIARAMAASPFADEVAAGLSRLPAPDQREAMANKEDAKA